VSAVETARGVLPLGNLGAWAFDQLLIDADPAAKTIVQLIDEGDERREAVDVEVNGTRLVGRLDHIFGRRRVEYRFGKLRPKDRLRLWVKHLVANATGWGAGIESCLVATGPSNKQKTETLILQSVEDPLDQLETLLELYQRGRQEPLLFYPEFSYSYAQKLNKSGEYWDDEASQKKARGSLKSNWDKRGAKDAWESQLILGGARPWEPGLKVGAIPGDETLSFHRLSEQIWAPLFRSAEKEGGV
jgi:exonuclease V gamma subunit